MVEELRRVGPALLAVVSVLLAGLIWLEIHTQQTLPVITQEAVRAALPLEDKPVAPSTSEDEGEVVRVLARPLFERSRRPAAWSKVAVPAAAPPSLPRLAGIVIDGERRSVIFASKGDNRTVTVSEGGRINQFQIESIKSGQVTVTGAGTRQFLRLDFDPSPPPANADAIASPNFLARPDPNTKLPVFNGPPGLANMPGVVSNLPIATSIMPGLPGPSSLSGVPGLSVPAATGMAQ